MPIYFFFLSLQNPKVFLAKYPWREYSKQTTHFTDLYFYSFLLRYYAITRFIVSFTSMLFQLILSFIILLLIFIRSSITYQYLRHYFSVLVSLNIIITIIDTSISLVNKKNKKKKHIYYFILQIFITFFLPN